MIEIQALVLISEFRSLIFLVSRLTPKYTATKKINLYALLANGHKLPTFRLHENASKPEKPRETGEALCSFEHEKE